MVSKASETLLKPSRKENDGNTSPSSHGSTHCKERAKASSHCHNGTRDSQERYNKSYYSKVHFDYLHVVNDGHKSWHQKTCSFCGLHHHVIVECWKRMAAQKRMRCERPSPQKGKKQVKQIWRKNTFCSHCNRGGHQRATHWRLHLEQRRKDKVPVYEPIEKVVRQVNPPIQEDDPFTLISERWSLQMCQLVMALFL